MPLLPPASMAMLQMVNLSAIERPSITGPQNSMAR